MKVGIAFQLCTTCSWLTNMQNQSVISIYYQYYTTCICPPSGNTLIVGVAYLVFFNEKQLFVEI